jgi:hypothetical protein
MKAVKLKGKETKCVYCNSGNCIDCLLPYSDEVKIYDILGKIPRNEEFEIDNTYYYLSERQRHCNSIENKDLVFELTWLPEVKNVCEDLNKKFDLDFRLHKGGSRGGMNIYDCFKNFVKLEKLQENNEWFCPQCKKHQKATKKMEIYQVPNFLIIHLKRFRNNNKIDCVIDFPIEGLNLKDIVLNKESTESDLIYDLYAISNHHGSLGFGHYIAYAKNASNGNWYQFDDSRVSPLSVKDLCTSSAYVLFYKRRGVESKINLQEIHNKAFINYENNIK